MSLNIPVAADNAPATPTSSAIAADTVTPPVRLRTIEPEYPASARAAQLEGDVLLQAVVVPDFPSL